jgi:hypothetical protein
MRHFLRGVLRLNHKNDYKFLVYILKYKKEVWL